MPDCRHALNIRLVFILHISPYAVKVSYIRLYPPYHSCPWSFFLCYRAIVSFVFTQDDWPPSLVHFCRQCQALKIPTQRFIKHAPQLPDKIRRGLTPKKQHEVMTLATFINAECNKYGITQVLDMGAGLVSTVVTLQICL
jgi:hypothetical protein